MIYLLAYFRTEAEALHLAWSREGLRWTPLNANRPVLHADVSNRSIRDPFIRFCSDGRYHLLSTDSWWSVNLLHASSHNLIDWEPWEVVPVMAEVSGARNTWAPEFWLDAARGVYLVFWSSITDETDHQRIWYAETADFHTYTAPKVLFDPGYSVIDATLAVHEGNCFLIYKDERGENRAGTDFKAMRTATASSPLGPFTPRTELLTPTLTEGPAVFEHEGRWWMLYDCFMEDRWGAAASTDLLQWEAIQDVAAPPGARHGSVFSIDEAQHQALLTAWR